MPGAWHNIHVARITVMAPTAMATKRNEKHKLHKVRDQNFTVLHHHYGEFIMFVAILMVNQEFFADFRYLDNFNPGIFKGTRGVY